jgi:hypothetical protein
MQVQCRLHNYFKLIYAYGVDGKIILKWIVERLDGGHKMGRSGLG